MSSVESISPRVSSIRLPLPLEGLTSVNCYVLQGSAETVLIDPGWSSPETEAALHEGLDLLGLTHQDISRTLITHHHWDHYTQAVTWQRRHGIPTYLGRGEDPSIRAWKSLEGAFPRQIELLKLAGAAALATRIANIPVESHERAMDFDLPADWLDDGETIDLGGLAIRVRATPGHTRGHVCFEIVGEGLLVTGDHVLPRITPSIAYEREPDPLSLVTYLESLRIVADLPDAAMLPAHGRATVPAATRALELITHHDERLDTIRSLVGSGRSTASEIASAMTWTRREKLLDELEPTHAMTAVLEVVAHLVVLERLNEVERRRDGDLDIYSPGPGFRAA